jgi:hypothetical protein
VQVPAFGWSRFDARPVGDGVLIGEVLHGRLNRIGWATVRDILAEVGPLGGAAVQRANGRAFWELREEELSVLGEPGTVGAALRAITRARGDHLGHVLAPLHYRYPALVPHLSRSTRRALFPHVEEGDSGVEAVIWRGCAPTRLPSPRWRTPSRPTSMTPGRPVCGCTTSCCG